ncbi:hypothetical protein ACQ4PT_007288 [Festuca glaucescens]
MGKSWALLTHLHSVAGYVSPCRSASFRRESPVMSDIVSVAAASSPSAGQALCCSTLCKYASICAMESPSKVDDEQWLAYWILYSFITLLELVAEPVLYWIPVWYPVKLLFVAWLALPQFKGASFIYEKFVREQLRKYRGRTRKGDSDHKVHILKAEAADNGHMH